MCEVAETLIAVVMNGRVLQVIRSERCLTNRQRRNKSWQTTKSIRIRLKSFDHKILDDSAEKIVAAAKKSGAQVVGPVPLPTEREVYTILRAVHKYKDSREQFEIRTHKRLIDIVNPTPETVDVLTRLELPSGVDIEIKL